MAKVDLTIRELTFLRGCTEGYLAQEQENWDASSPDWREFLERLHARLHAAWEADADRLVEVIGNE